MKQHGFSLTELLVVVAIIGVISSIAIPSYNDYVVRANRTEAINGLLDLMRAQNDFFANEYTYTEDLTQLNYKASHDTYSGKYKITASKCGAEPIADCVLLTATAQGNQAKDGNLTLNSRGQRTYKGKPDWPN